MNEEFADQVWEAINVRIDRKHPCTNKVINRTVERIYAVDLHRLQGNTPTHTDQREGYRLMSLVQAERDKRVDARIEAKLAHFALEPKQSELSLAAAQSARQIMSREDWLAGVGPEAEDVVKGYLGKTVNQCRELVSQRHLLMTKDDQNNLLLTHTKPIQFAADLADAFGSGKWVKRADYEIFLKPCQPDMPVECSEKIKHIMWVRRKS